PTTAPPSGRPHWIEDWRPEDPEFWASGGGRVARRNLSVSVFSEHIGFSIWSLWSVLVLFLPEPVFGIDPAGKFLLTTLPTALGAGPQRRRRQPRRPGDPAGRPAGAGHRRRHPHPADPLDLPAADRPRRRVRGAAHGQPGDGAQPAARDAPGHPRAAHLDHVVA